jgi:hypothetical protein
MRTGCAAEALKSRMVHTPVHTPNLACAGN